MRIKNAWNIPQLPNSYIIETESGELKMFLAVPSRRITEKDLRPYKGHHPSVCSGTPLIKGMCMFYGLEMID